MEAWCETIDSGSYTVKSRYTHGSAPRPVEEGSKINEVEEKIYECIRVTYPGLKLPEIINPVVGCRWRYYSRTIILLEFCPYY